MNNQLREDPPQIVSRTCHVCNKTLMLRFTNFVFRKESEVRNPNIKSKSSGYTFLPGSLFYKWGEGYSEFHCWECTKKCLESNGAIINGFEYTLQDYAEGIECLTNKINKPYSIVCGIARAGAIPAAHLAMNLSAAVCILDMNFQLSIDFFELLLNSNTNILMVDDFINEGKGIRRFSNLFPTKKLDWATLVLNTSCEEAKKVPTIYHHKTIDKSINAIFVKFPWGTG